MLLLTGMNTDREHWRRSYCECASGLLLVWILLGSGAAAQQESQFRSLSTQARQALQQQKYGEAQIEYEKILKIDPNSAEAYSNLGLALYMQGHYEAATSRFLKALELNPSLSNSRVLLALCYFNTSRFGQAIPILEQAYSEAKTDPVVVEHLGMAYLKVHEHEKALALLSRWAQLEPDNADALYYKGQAALEVMIESLVKLKEVAPDSARIHQIQAEFFRQQGQTEPAITEYKVAIEKRPQLSGLHYALGTLYWEKGRLDEARQEFLQELRLSPSDPPTNYLMGDVYLQLQNLAESEKYLSQAIRLQPDLVNAQLDLARVYRQQGEAIEAIKKLQEIAQMAPDRQEPHYMLYELYRSEGQRELAAKELEAFQNLKRKAVEKTASESRMNPRH